MQGVFSQLLTRALAVRLSRGVYRAAHCRVVVGGLGRVLHGCMVVICAVLMFHRRVIVVSGMRAIVLIILLRAVGCVIVFSITLSGHGCLPSFYIQGSASDLIV